MLFLFNRRRKWSRTHTWLRVYVHLNTEKVNNKWVFQKTCDLCDMRWSLSKKYTGEGQKFSLKQYLVNKKEYFAPGQVAWHLLTNCSPNSSYPLIHLLKTTLIYGRNHNAIDPNLKQAMVSNCIVIVHMSMTRNLSWMKNDNNHTS